MAMSIGNRSKSTISEINVTPMADVMIVLLIIFMVTVPLIQAPVRLPDAAQAREHKGDQIEVVLQTNGLVTLGDEHFASAAALGDHLVLLYEGRPAPTVLIQADESATYAEVESVLSACRRAGTVDILLGARLPVGR